MSLASREALNKLISSAEVEHSAKHAEDWSTCSTTAVLAAAADKLGKLTEQRAFKDDTGNTRRDWSDRRSDLKRCLVLSRRRQHTEARKLLIKTAKVLQVSVQDVAAKAPADVSVAPLLRMSFGKCLTLQIVQPVQLGSAGGGKKRAGFKQPFGSGKKSKK